MDSVLIDLQSGHAGAGYECLDEISKSCYLKRPKNDTTVMRLHSDHKISVIKNLTANTILAVLSVISKITEDNGMVSYGHYESGGQGAYIKSNNGNVTTYPPFL